MSITHYIECDVEGCTETITVEPGYTAKEEVGNENWKEIKTEQGTLHHCSSCASAGDFPRDIVGSKTGPCSASIQPLYPVGFFEIGDELMLISHLPDGQLTPVVVVGQHKFMPNTWIVKKEDGRHDLAKPHFLFKRPKQESNDE